MIKRKGFTLLEVLIAVTISVLASGLLFVIVTNVAGLFYHESSRVEQGLNVNDALMQLRESIKGASDITATYSSYASGSEQLILNVPTIDQSGNIVSDTFDYYVFFKDVNKLRFKIFPNVQSSRKAQDQIFSTNVNSLLFQYLNSSNPPQEVSPTSAVKIRATIKLRQKSGANFEEIIATSEASLRND